MKRAVLIVTSLALLATGAGAVQATTSKPAASAAISNGTGPLDNAGDLAAMKKFEGLIPHFDINGMLVPFGYDKWPELDPTAQPLHMDGAPDSGNYTGVYLAAESFRYTQAKAELKRLGVPALGSAKISGLNKSTSEAVTFWRGQRDEALKRGAEIARYYHVLINIAKYWRTALDPKIDTSHGPTDEGFFDVGGGLVPGEAGLLMRTCTRASNKPAYKDLRTLYSSGGRLRGPFRWEDGQDWYCLEGTSRDSYSGTYFGLGVALDFLGPDENPELRHMIGDDLTAMTDYAVKYLWNQPRPHGRVVLPVGGGNDLNGPISPLFLQVPVHRLGMLSAARHAAHVNGVDAKIRKYDALWAAEAPVDLTSGQAKASMLADATQPHDTYYKYQLHLMFFFNMIRVEQDPAIRQQMLDALSPMDGTIKDDGNAFFEAMSYAISGEKDRLKQGIAHHHEWLDYYAFHVAAAKSGHTPFLHTPRCYITSAPKNAPLEKQPLKCTKEDEVNMITPMPDGSELATGFKPGTSENLRAFYPLPVGQRRLADFLWQKKPTIVGGDHKTPWAGPSIDFLISYWMLRYYSEIAPPASTPIPAWTGPRWY